MACPRCAGSAVIFLLNPQPSTLPSPPPRCAGTAAISSAAISAPSRCTPHASGSGPGWPSSSPSSSGETPLRGGRVIRPRGGDEGSAPPREERLRTSVHPHLRTSAPPHLRVWPSDRGTPPLVTFPLPSPFLRVWKSHRACPHHTCPPCDLLTHPHLCDPPPPPGPAPSTRAPPADARPLPPVDSSSAARYALGRRESGFGVRGRLSFRCATDMPVFGLLGLPLPWSLRPPSPITPNHALAPPLHLPASGRLACPSPAADPLLPPPP